MTRHRPDDDIVSAVLDGVADADEVARVRDDPAVSARLSELRAAADAVGRPVRPLPSDVVDDLVARALAASSGVADQGNDAHDGAEVVTLARPRKGTRAPGTPTRWLAAAAAVIVVALGIPLALGLGDDADDRTETATAPNDEAATAEALDRGGDATDDDALDAEVGEASGAAPPGAAGDVESDDAMDTGALPATPRSTLPPSTTIPGLAAEGEAEPGAAASSPQLAPREAPPLELGDLGVLPGDPAAAAAVAADVVRAGLAAADPDTAGPTPGIADPRGCADNLVGGSVVAVATATRPGTLPPVLVVVLDEGDSGRRTVVIVDPTTCIELSRSTLNG